MPASSIHKIQFSRQATANKQQQTTTWIFITTHNNYDSNTYFSVIFNIDVYEPKQSKEAITDIDESNTEIFSFMAALVIDIYQRTQTEKTLFLSNTARKQPLKKFIKQRFLSLCSMAYINNQSIYDTENFTV